MGCVAWRSCAWALQGGADRARLAGIYRPSCRPAPGYPDQGAFEPGQKNGCFAYRATGESMNRTATAKKEIPKFFNSLIALALRSESSDQSWEKGEIVKDPIV